ncbi:MAG TPA: hypothetical protein VND65_23055 [Candidatus Binatia bacterium]|nr:hypothetical protein [Candidatus Binatia bacterium]
MRRLALTAVLLFAGLCHAQSLADAARENRKQKPNDGSSSKVIDTDDLSAPGDLTIRLLPGAGSNGSGAVTAPGRGKHSYVVTHLDATRFPNGGTLHITISLGSGASEASFDLFPQGASLPTEGFPHALASAHNMLSGATAKIDYHFDRGSVFQLAAEGSWNSKAGDTNTYSFTVEVAAQ